MVYMGSKNRIAKEILPLILKDRKEEQFYIEPFCGGCNLVDKISGNRIANDMNPYLIALFEKLLNGWNPPEKVSKEEYDLCRISKDQFEKHIVGYIGFVCSFRGKFFNGFVKSEFSTGRNRQDEMRRNVVSQIESLRGIYFCSGAYDKLILPKESLIYCDPPYEGTTSYKINETKFDHEAFWQWCREKKKEGHQIFISEFTAPEDFECIWEKKLKNCLSVNSRSVVTEKLWTLK